MHRIPLVVFFFFLYSFLKPLALAPTCLLAKASRWYNEWTSSKWILTETSETAKQLVVCVWTCVLVVVILYWMHIIKPYFPARRSYDTVQYVSVSWCCTEGMVFYKPPPWLVGSALPEEVQDGDSRREPWEEGGQRDTDRQRESRYQGWASVCYAWDMGCSSLGSNETSQKDYQGKV